MTATGHAVIGTVIAAKIGNPALAIPLALASHVAADFFPHWDTGFERYKKSENIFIRNSVVDVIMSFTLSFLLVYFLFPQTSYAYAFIMVIAAQFFDWATAPYLFLKWNFPPFTWAYRFQMLFDRPMAKPWGVIGQVAVLAALVFLAIKF
ncbi:MAG: hypothetical protein ACD_37C00136G0002 [uncultured bacterium]|nr:MAG: hypothetical protein ACD_37C00136G0002 [uncultured bacterium]KKR15437.1 MAG: hypothetical protein UT44_C0034G0007 [Candidatus Levybacteria bacterium GW2011_GWA1_39_32]KKR50793.1 MAG: hypothetical protein UT87_C0012G0038 [Candidatus Levybacteria bacterium GW2011_GWC1_40_19]KKR93203.1 MAG: hypothetical protein UU45_C0025G0007 [Candidatus Levybacteria bacterium GW2011_GWA2_41_15]KKS00448.1 MAG: hypothetical protein UU52_C0033G0010 [Candidatus Levybacteria bacterium GW2011_GWB1_41_21]OGH20